MRNSWPIYHPETGKCIRRTRTSSPTCMFTGNQWICDDSKNQTEIDPCTTESTMKWTYKNNNLQNNSTLRARSLAPGAYYMVNLDSLSKVPSHLHGQYYPNTGKNITTSNGNKIGQVHLNVLGQRLINNTSSGDIKLVTSPASGSNKNFNFESPLFNKNNDILLNRWYKDSNLKNWKSEVKKAFQYLLGNNRNMQKECCKRSNKYHKELCGNWYGSNNNSNCEGILSDNEKTNCCRGIGNQYSCGKYWGPTHNGSCNNILKSYCSNDGLSDPKCGCLWPMNKYDENLYKIGGPELDIRCNPDGYKYIGQYWDTRPNEVIDNNCKILFDRIANNETINYSPNKDILESACSRYLEEQAKIQAEEEALLRQLQAEEQERIFEATTIKNNIDEIFDNISEIKNKIGEFKSLVNSKVSGLTSSLAVNAMNIVNNSYNVAVNSFENVGNAFNLAETAIIEADVEKATNALNQAELALNNIQQALISAEQAYNDAKAAKQVALEEAQREAEATANAEEQRRIQAEMEEEAQEEQAREEQAREEEARKREEEARKVANELLAKQEAEQQALLEEQELVKEELEKTLIEENIPEEQIQEEIRKLQETQVKEQQKLAEIQEEEKKQVFKEIGFSIEEESLLSTPVIIILVVVVLLVLLGIGTALIIKLRK